MATIGQGLASLGESVGEGLKKRGEREQERSELDVLFENVKKDIRPDKLPKYQDIYEEARKSKDPIASFSTGVTLLEKFGKETPSEARLGGIIKTGIEEGVPGITKATTFGEASKRFREHEASEITRELIEKAAFKGIDIKESDDRFAVIADAIKGSQTRKSAT